MRSIKQGIKALFRPILRPLLLRLELPMRVMQPRLDAVERAIAQIDAAIGRLDAAHGATVGRVQDLEHHSTHDKTLIGALRNENSNLVRGWLRMRTDLLRLEQTVGAQELVPEPAWVRIAPAALAALAERARPLRLHLSRDGRRNEGAVNVGNRARAGVDLIADLADLPFASQSVDAITVSGPADDVEPALLAHWRTLLRPGAALDFVD
jgi:hypothetical protein